MSEDYEKIGEAEQTNELKERFIAEKLGDVEGYGEDVERYNGTVKTSLDGENLEGGKDSVEAMLDSWKENNS